MLQPKLPLDFADGLKDAMGSERMTSQRLEAPTLSGLSTRALGAYYTPSPAAELLARWVVRHHGDSVLEPSMGDGAFLQAIARATAGGPGDIQVWGAEIAADTYESTVGSGLIDSAHALRSDFMAVTPFQVNGVVGNPPYVRLRHLPADQAQRAIEVAGQVLGEPMDPAGSLWMPFVLHATRFLANGGRLGFVLPYDLTYVRYARSLWRFLGENFRTLRVVRVYERVFPDILQDVVLFLADGFGGSTSHVEFDAYRTVDHLVRNSPDMSARLPIARIRAGDRVFLEALLPSETQALIHERVLPATVPARDLVTFNIGYVCGDKTYFHPDPSTVDAFALPGSSLRRALTSARQLRGVGLFTTEVPSEKTSRLFLPSQDTTALARGEVDYIEYGRTQQVHQRYKCRIRNPWYVTPGVKIPDVLVPVFTERPVMLVNDAGLVASNSLLCGYLRQGEASSLVAAWFTSLTLLQLELQIHALGGGVMVLVPREAGAIRLPMVKSVSSDHLQEIQSLLLEERLDHAFASGDHAILQGELGFTTREVQLLQEAATELAYWRTSSRSSV